MAPEEIFFTWSLNGEFVSSVLHLLPLIYPFFDLCGSGSVIEIRIRIDKAAEYGSN